MSFLKELHKNMKSRFDEKSRITFSYNDNFIIVKHFHEGSAYTFSHENFKNFLTFLNECDIIVGREKALDVNKNGN